MFAVTCCVTRRHGLVKGALEGGNPGFALSVYCETLCLQLSKACWSFTCFSTYNKQYVKITTTSLAHNRIEN